MKTVFGIDLGDERLLPEGADLPEIGGDAPSIVDLADGQVIVGRRSLEGLSPVEISAEILKALKAERGRQGE